MFVAIWVSMLSCSSTSLVGGFSYPRHVIGMVVCLNGSLESQLHVMMDGFFSLDSLGSILNTQKRKENVLRFMAKTCINYFIYNLDPLW